MAVNRLAKEEEEAAARGGRPKGEEEEARPRSDRKGITEIDLPIAGDPFPVEVHYGFTATEAIMQGQCTRLEGLQTEYHRSIACKCLANFSELDAFNYLPTFQSGFIGYTFYVPSM